MSEKHVAALLGGEAVLGKKIGSRLSMADAIVKGLPEKSLDRIKDALGLTDGEMSATLGMSPKTIGRMRLERSPLSTVTSDRLYRLARIYALAQDVLEDGNAAREWLRRPQIGLGNRVPLDLLATEAGAREVEDLLGRIEHGVLA
jgi:putative toxin-antitoxin system antitoxin component (TIGR02293 family)